MLVVNFKKLHADAKLPVKGSVGAACHDVYATSMEHKDGKCIYKLGFATQIPEGWRGVIVPRSNLSKHRWVMGNHIGIIDSDYRGEWMVVLNALEYHLIPPYQVGDRVAQIYFERVSEVAFAEVDDLDQTVRGEGGFGSTGVSSISDASYTSPNYVTNTTNDV
jgi:dUTP pyrophosphatase